LIPVEIGGSIGLALAYRYDCQRFNVYHAGYRTVLSAAYTHLSSHVASVWADTETVCCQYSVDGVIGKNNNCQSVVCDASA
jgi:hypothetical protein